MSDIKKQQKKYFIEREAGGDKAVLVHVELPASSADLTEFKELVRSAGANVLALVTGRRDRPESKYFVGSGKADEIKHVVSANAAEIVIFNHDLTPAQERNLEQLLQCRVIDRTGLILDIFAQRARTFEGKLQVELAQLKHLSTRLVRGWTHLERQRGGIGLRGPGETQLETDRRLIGSRMKTINKRLQKVEVQRDQSRRSRIRAAIPTISLVGYTNAGKSTLFNSLTEAHVYAAEQLFATLDPTLRTLEIPLLGKVIISDTVGFVRDLPHDLVAAFKSTLEETRQAQLLLHVIDAHHAEKIDLINAVENVLTEIDAHELPILEVYNKIDLCEETEPRIDRNEEGLPWRVWCSALTGVGLDLLKSAILERLGDTVVNCEIILTPQAGRVRASLYQQGVVLSEETQESGDIILQVRMQRIELEKLLMQEEVKLHVA